MLELFKAGGFVMWIIAVAYVLAVAIVAERFWSLKRSSVLPAGLGDEVCDWARNAHLDPQHIQTLRENSPLGEVLAAGLDVRRRPREIIRERIEDAGRQVVHRLERYLNTLGTIATISPLLGLLGTVIGMIRMFLGILEHGIGDMTKLAGGIGEALITTAAGICVAIPALIFYRYFRGLIQAYVVEMERQANTLIDTLEGMSVNGPGAPAAGAATAPRRRSVPK